MIEVKGVSKTYGNNTVIKDISFTISKGENFILLGTSGCGKTTTLKLINRLAEVSQGIVAINGIDVKEQQPEELRRKIGYVLQRNSLFPHYTIAQNIAVVPNLLQWDKNKIEERTTMFMEKLHLPEDFLSVYPEQLSGGEAQRVNLARALVSDPDILLMDEPFSALDTITRKAIRSEFIQLEEFKNKTIVLVTHDVQEAFELADRICLMDKGKIVQIGTPKELLFNPANDFVRSFLSDAYMQLLLIVTTITEIWPYLINEQNAAKISIAISSELSVLSAVEAIKDKNSSDCMLTITHEKNGEIKNIRWNTLLSVFSNYKHN